MVNAIEAMKGLEGQRGGLERPVARQRRRGPDRHWRYGRRHPAEVLPQIFDPFFSTKEQENGVGLGLAVVYGIVQRHGGQISVESKVGQGTVFHLRLPRAA